MDAIMNECSVTDFELDPLASEVISADFARLKTKIELAAVDGRHINYGTLSHVVDTLVMIPIETIHEEIK